MKKNSLRITAALLCLASFAGTACKKTTHSNDPIPENTRLLGFSRLATSTATGKVYTENFRFYYDNANRINQIIYTGNKPGQGQTRTEFAYGQDMVYKKVIDIVTHAQLYTDTFFKNSLGQIVKAHIYSTVPSGSRNKITIEYNGKLLTRVNKEANNWDKITMTAGVIYTSVNGDLLKQDADKQLHVQFATLNTPFTIKWQQSAELKGEIPGHTSYTYTFDTYDPAKEMYVVVDDALSNPSSLVYPAWNWSNESYHFYTESANRMGDYMQLESIVMYGQNIYNNDHLVESISSADKNAHITYRIDAQSKISQTTVTVLDKQLNQTQYVYDMQYEKY